MVYGVAYLIYGFGLDYEDFSSMPYGVTHPNMVYRFGLDYEDFSSMLYALAYRVAYSSAYNTWRLDLVHVPPLGYII